MSSTDSFMLMQSSATPVLVVWCLSSDENRVLQFLTSPVASKAKSVFGLRHQPSTPNPNLLSGVVFGGLGTRLDNIFVNLVHQYKCKKCIAMYCKQTTFLVIIPFLSLLIVRPESKLMSEPSRSRPSPTKSQKS